MVVLTCGETYSDVSRVVFFSHPLIGTVRVDEFIDFLMI